MKTIKSGLAALALMASSCAHERAFTPISSFYSIPQPHEEFSVRLNHYNGPFDKVDVIMSDESYSIINPENHCYFIGSLDSGFLSCGGHKFYDGGIDGTLDGVLLNHQYYTASNLNPERFQRLQNEYNLERNSLEQQEIHDIWLRRWKRGCGGSGQ